MFKIPQSTKEFKQDNSSDRKGNISITKNISFDKKGYISLSQKLRTIANDTTLADLSTYDGYGVSKIYPSNDSSTIWLLGTKNIYQAPTSTPYAFAKDTDVGVPTLDGAGENDVIEFNTKTYVVVGANAKAYTKDGSTWANFDTPASGTCLCLFENLNQIAIGTPNNVYLYNTANALQNTLELPDQYVVTKMAWNNSRLYIATYNSSDKDAILFEWDGLTSEANAGYRAIGSHTIYSVQAYKDGVVCITSSGELLYNRGGWQVLDRLPIYYKKIPWQSSSNTGSIFRKVSKHSMVVEGDLIFIGLDSSISYTGAFNTPRFYQDFPSGGWCYDPEVGLHHKFSLDNALALQTSVIATTDVDVSTNVITVAGATVPITGTPVYYYNKTTSLADSSSATPLINETKYFTIYVSDTTLKLATTYANAIAGTAIDLTGTGNTLQFLVFTPVNQIGGTRNYPQALALATFSGREGRSRNYIDRIMAGGLSYNIGNTIESVVAYGVTDDENRGYFITPRLESEGIEDIFKKTYLKFKPLLTAEDKIIVKCRLIDDTLPNYDTRQNTTYKTNVWVDGNTFTTTQDISLIKDRADAGIFDEVEIIAFNGSGYTAHITSITESSGTYTVNIDETILGINADDYIRVVYSNWTKLDEITIDSDTNLKGFKEIPMPSDSSIWSQIKIELRGYDTTINETQIISKTDRPSV